MSDTLRVAHTFRVLATVFHRRELALAVDHFVKLSRFGRFVALEQRDRPTGRERYLEGFRA